MPQSAPDQNQNSPKDRPEGALGGLVKAERLMQIAVALPISVLVGWSIGALLDKWLHQQWIYLVGVVLGAVAGFIEIFHIINQYEKDNP